VPSPSLAVGWPLLKATLSWAVAALGFLIGLFLASVLISRSPSTGMYSAGLGLRALAFVGLWLVAIGLLAGSIAALRNPRRAAIIFLSLLPVTALCLAYPDMAVEPVSADAVHVFDLPLLLEVAGLTVLFFVPILVPLFFFDNRKRAGISFVVGLLVAALAFARFRWTELLLRDLIIVSAPLLLFGLFWLGANSFGWPGLLRSWPQSTFRRFSSGVVVIVVLACASAAMAVVTAAYGSSLFSGDCRAKHPFTNATYESHAVFTARAVYVGLSLSSRRQIRQNPQVIDPRVGDWAIGTVQERFWGMPAGWPHLVLMTNFVFWKGETYFIDGDRVRNIAGILPVVEGGIGCSRSRRVEDAIIDMRLLHQAPPHRAAIVGYVRQPGPFSSMMTPPVTPKFLAGAQIEVSGPAGTTTVTTDASGIYELDGLLEGDYTIQLHVPAGETVDRISSDRSVRKLSLKSDDLIESSFYLEWDKGHGDSEH
jgi:hypothetical protein